MIDSTQRTISHDDCQHRSQEQHHRSIRLQVSNPFNWFDKAKSLFHIFFDPQRKTQITSLANLLYRRYYAKLIKNCATFVIYARLTHNYNGTSLGNL